MKRLWAENKQYVYGGVAFGLITGIPLWTLWALGFIDGSGQWLK